MHSRDYSWNSSNTNNYLNNTLKKSTIVSTDLEEEIKFDTFYVQYNKRLSK